VRVHIGCVLKGKMEITFADHTETFAAGDGVFIPPGEPGKHRGKVLTDTVRLILVEDM
jgi:quercetin dioxygenase-like cupin family protein